MLWTALTGSWVEKTLLIANRLAVDHKRDLSMISERMKETIAVSRDSTRRVDNRLA
jgi:hypothetical protein